MSARDKRTEETEEAYQEDDSFVLRNSQLPRLLYLKSIYLLLIWVKRASAFSQGSMLIIPNNVHQNLRTFLQRPSFALFSQVDGSKTETTADQHPDEQSPSMATSKFTTTINTVTTTTTTTLSSVDEYSFFDQATLYVRAGSGGQGSPSYQLTKKHQKGLPDGGNGGRGGHVILQVDPSLNTLAGLSNAHRPNAHGGSGAAAVVGTTKNSNHHTTAMWKSFRAENGAPGERQGKSGKFGKDCIVRVPPGTVVQERIEVVESASSTTTDMKNGTTDDTNHHHHDSHSQSTTTVHLLDICTLTNENPQIVIARGGQGGEGTGVLLKNGRGVSRPRVAAQGGERKWLELTLKVIADVALVGVPNAGKSTLLAAVTNAKPKIANYPFTTVIPNLGVWVPKTMSYNDYSDDDDDLGGSGSDGLVLCDVPGLIEGASDGVGLGHAFLRHVERCHVLLHLVDATSTDPIADYEMINREIVQYGTGQLAKMPQVVVVNKIDELERQWEDDDDNAVKPKYTRDELEAELQRVLPHTRLMWMSAKEREGVDDLMQRLAAFVKKVKSVAP